MGGHGEPGDNRALAVRPSTVPAGPSVTQSVRPSVPSVRPSTVPAGSSVTRSVRPSVRPIRPSVRQPFQRVRPSVGPSVRPIRPFVAGPSAVLGPFPAALRRCCTATGSGSFPASAVTPVPVPVPVPVPDSTFPSLATGAHHTGPRWARLQPRRDDARSRHQHVAEAPVPTSTWQRPAGLRSKPARGAGSSQNQHVAAPGGGSSPNQYVAAPGGAPVQTSTWRRPAQAPF